MTPLPPVTPSTTAQYDQLIAILTTSLSILLEIDILPSSFPPTILHSNDPPSLGLPKALLIPLFLIASQKLFSYKRSQDKHESGTEERYKQALDATMVILLWDPNHLTAANFRKRHIVKLIDEGPTEISSSRQNGEALKEAITRELVFLESLLASPLPKHPKSSTLWSYRLWLLTTISKLSPSVSSRQKSTPKDIDRKEVHARWASELVTVKRAGERHPRNYYAWNYARVLFEHLSLSLWGGVDYEMKRGIRRELATRSIRDVHRWCLQHPRDISGWSFVVFLLHVGDYVGDEDGEFEDEVGRAVRETREFVRKFGRRGESVEWFSRAVERFNAITVGNSV